MHSITGSQLLISAGNFSSTMSKRASKKTVVVKSRATSTKKPLPLTESDPMSDHEKLTMDGLKLWSVSALQAFLMVRKKSIDGNHDTLAAR